jgi:hypothetical protein
MSWINQTPTKDKSKTLKHSGGLDKSNPYKCDKLD